MPLASAWFGCPEADVVERPVRGCATPGSAPARRRAPLRTHARLRALRGTSSRRRQSSSRCFGAAVLGRDYIAERASSWPASRIRAPGRGESRRPAWRARARSVSGLSGSSCAARDLGVRPSTSSDSPQRSSNLPSSTIRRQMPGASPQGTPRSPCVHKASLLVSLSSLAATADVFTPSGSSRPDFTAQSRTSTLRTIGWSGVHGRRDTSTQSTRYQCAGSGSGPR